MSHNPFPWNEPLPEQPKTRIEVIRVPLFYSANWKVVIFVDDEEKWSSHEEPNQPSAEEVRDWLGMMIVNNYSAMKLLNIDLAKLYKSGGGDPCEFMWF